MKQETLETVYDLTKEVNQLKSEKKDSAAGYRDQIKVLEKEISDLIDDEEDQTPKQ